MMSNQEIIKKDPYDLDIFDDQGEFWSRFNGREKLIKQIKKEIEVVFFNPID